MSHDGRDLPLAALILLRENAELEKDTLGLEWGFRAMTSVCDAALRRVELLERKLSKQAAAHTLAERPRRSVRPLVKQERKVRAALFPRSGDVIPLPVRNRDGVK